MAAALALQSRPASGAETSRAGENTTGAYDDGLSTFMSVRPRLLGIAYRMLGTTAEAEDVVQDAWVRWQATDRNRDTSNERIPHPLLNRPAGSLQGLLFRPIRTRRNRYPATAVTRVPGDRPFA